jgi:release factor glutamine methyltransferase
MASLRQKIDWLLREKYQDKRSSTTERDIKRLEAGEHIDYVIGFSNFLGCRIFLSKRPLIPRPETEYWVQKVIQSIKDAKRPLAILDIFAGSGAIGISVLKHVSKARLTFAELDPAYFADIRKSARLNDIAPKRLKIIGSDVFSSVSGIYDYILANPPYIATAGRKVQRSVLEQEPHAALFAGKDGLRFIRELLKKAKKHLAPEGTLVIEFDPPQKTEIGALARRLGYRVQFFKDQYGRWRFVSLKFQLRARSRSLA